MSLEWILAPAAQVGGLPEGAVNVRYGAAIEGPGGRWVPCATAIAEDAFLPCIFEVGLGRRQVCGTTAPSASETEALALARQLALTAAA